MSIVTLTITYSNDDFAQTAEEELQDWTNEHVTIHDILATRDEFTMVTLRIGDEIAIG